MKQASEFIKHRQESIDSDIQAAAGEMEPWLLIAYHEQSWSTIKCQGLYHSHHGLERGQI